MKNKSPIVSVIVLTYNNFRNIEKNIRSIQSQDYENIEIIVHDDCSTDFPEERITKLLSLKETRYGYKIGRNEINRGTVKNYNRALEIAKGDIIVPLAQDDRFYSETSIRDIVNYFLENDCYVCTGNRIGESSGARYPKSRDARIMELGEDKNILLRIMISNFISGATLYINKTKFSDQLKHFFDEKYILLEDYPFIFRCLKKHTRIGYINKDLIIYGEHGVSSSKGKTSKELLKDQLLLFNSEIVPALNLIKSSIVRKYIKYQLVKTEYDLSRIDNKKKNGKRSFLLGNPDLAFSVFIMYLADLFGYDRYNLIFRWEELAEKKFPDPN